MTDSRLKPLSLAAYTKRLREYPQDEEQLTDQLWKRYFAWQEILITSVLAIILILSVVGNDNPLFVVIMAIDLFVIGACSVPAFILAVRILIAHFIAHKVFLPRRSSFRWEEKADRAIEAYKRHGASKVATWICLPSNFEVIAGLVVGSLAALTTSQFLAA